LLADLLYFLFCLTFLGTAPHFVDAGDCCGQVGLQEARALANMSRVFETLSLRDKTVQKWKLIALIIDRCLFLVFSVITLISSTLLLIFLPVLKHQDVI